MPPVPEATLAVAATAKSTLPSLDRLREVRHEMRSHLHEGLIPFWLERAADRERGGYRTNFDASGRAQPTPEKYLNTQCRLLWWFSQLQRRFPGRPEFAREACHGFEFIRQHFWDARDGGWFWKVDGDGRSLDEGKAVYGQSFAIYAFAEFHRATGDVEALRLAERTFDLLQIHAADTVHGGYFEYFERDWQPAPGGEWGGDRKGLDTHLHLMESFTTLSLASGRAPHRRKLAEVIALITTRMIDPVTGCGRNQFDAGFRPLPAIALQRTWNAERRGDAPAAPTDTTSYGHNLELAWLLRLAAEAAGLAPAEHRDVTGGLVRHALEHGVDWDCGGIYRDGLGRGAALVHEKEFWQHAEALVGLLDAFEVLGEPRCLDAFLAVWRFVWSHMINHDAGEWRTLLTREGRPLDANLGNPWKVSYHTGRALLESLDRLDRLLGSE